MCYYVTVFIYYKHILYNMATLRISDELMSNLKKYNAKEYNGDVYGKITDTAEKAIKEYIGGGS